MASDLQELRALALQRDAFTLLTGMALMLSIGALIGSWSWQPRVTFLTANLAAVAGDLLALLLTSACCIFMYTAWGHMLLGDVYGPFSTFQGALHQLVDAFVSGEAPVFMRWLSHLLKVRWTPPLSSCAGQHVPQTPSPPASCAAEL